MKRYFTALAVAGLAVFFLKTFAQAENPSIRTSEYVTIRWAGRENTHLIRPGGKVEFIGSELRKLSKPDRTDDRSFYMNAALNGLANEGYEVAAMTPDEILMKRTK